VVKASATINNLKLLVSTSKKATDGSGGWNKVTKQQGLPKGLRASSSDSEYIHVTFDLTPENFIPHQAFVRFTHLDTNLDTFFVAKPSGSGGGGFTATINLSEELPTFLYRAGEYEVSLLIGDVALVVPVEFAMGTITLDFPAKTKPTYPLYTRPLLHDSDNALGPMPEIHHQFRSPAPRPPIIVSTAFIILVLAPLVIFILGLPVVGANTKGLPGGFGVVWTLGLFASLLGFLILLSSYWFTLTMFTTLRYLVPLSVITVITGRGALRARASEAAKPKSS